MLDPQDPNLQPPYIVFLMPCYGGTITSACFHSFLKFVDYARDNGIEWDVFTHTHCSLISLGRSIMISQAVQDLPDWTHLMWIDADIEWEPTDVMKLLVEDKDIIGGYYPCKTFPLIQASAPKSHEGEETETLVETPYIATGFMLIKRTVCEAMHEHYMPELKFYYGSETHRDRRYVDLFAPIIDKEKNDLYLTEDYAFCKRANDIGFKSWMSKRVKLGHVMGSWVFSEEAENKMLDKYETKNKIKRLDKDA